MEIDVYSVLNSNGKLTPAEKSHCQKLNLCLYCGRTGHHAKECPSKKGKSSVTAIASTPSLGSSSSSNPENADLQASVPYILGRQPRPPFPSHSLPVPIPLH